MITDGIIESRNREGEQFGNIKVKSNHFEMNANDNPLEKIKNEFYQIHRWEI